MQKINREALRDALNYTDFWTAEDLPKGTNADHFVTIREAAAMLLEMIEEKP